MRHLTTIILAVAGWFAATGGFTGSGSPPPEPRSAESRPADSATQVATPASTVAEGRQAYELYCIGCHGATGDGRGPAAGFLDPRPRNFQTAEFKFNSRGIGELPTDDDLKRTIRHGLRGSAMPAFRLLPERTLENLIAYLKTFSPRWKQETPGSPIPFVADPWREDKSKSAAIERGRLVYHGFAACWSCHPAYVSTEKIDAYLVMMNDEPRGRYRQDIHQSIGRLDTDGNILYPPDFMRDFVRSGAGLRDLYRSIGAGIQGSAMPEWIDSIEYQPEEDKPPLTTRADLWAMAYYVQDLIRQRPPKLEEGAFEVRKRPYAIFAAGLPEVPPAAGMPAEDERQEDGAGPAEPLPAEDHANGDHHDDADHNAEETE